MSLALRASLDEFHYLLTHSGPPIVLFRESNGLADSWVSISQWVVMGMDDTSLIVEASGDYSSSLFIPCTMDLLEVMGVYPTS